MLLQAYSLPRKLQNALYLLLLLRSDEQCVNVLPYYVLVLVELLAASGRLREELTASLGVFGSIGVDRSLRGDSLLGLRD